MEELDECDYRFKKEIDEIFIGLKSLDLSKERDECFALIEKIKYKLQNRLHLDIEHDTEIEKALTTVTLCLRLYLYSNEKITTLNNCIKCLKNVLDLISDTFYYHELFNAKKKHTTSIFNSEKFYKEKIEQANKEKEELANKIDAIKKELESTTDESEKTKKELEKKEQELCNYIELISLYEAEKLQNEKINDAKVEWNGQIATAFDKLKEYIDPMKNEHNRLKYLFWGYLGLSVLVVLCLLTIEIIICCKINEVKGLLTWETYLPYILPVPIAVGGLWGFITLMHRVQHQLEKLARQIHEIEYVEGLLLTTNTLSTNINESTNKVNMAIEKLLENHLKYNDSASVEEALLEKEDNKDAMPYEVVLKLVKEVVGIVTKNKE